MSPDRKIKNVVLTGFMGVGKTSVGHIVARMLDFRFLDTDAIIESQAGMSITDLFAQKGEAAFRDIESAVIQSLENAERVVISTGGGAVLRAANLASLQKHALVCCLWACPETIYKRVKNQTHRPLLAGPDPLSRITELLAERKPSYLKADALIASDFRSAHEVAYQVAHQFNAARPKPARPK